MVTFFKERCKRLWMDPVTSLLRALQGRYLIRSYYKGGLKKYNVYVATPDASNVAAHYSLE
ncbi:MAG: hypothetical protein ACJA0Z_003800 [Halioglobus sp.]|jgi:hypothetical protein